jgi:peptide/nickel transport system permease protein
MSDLADPPRSGSADDGDTGARDIGDPTPTAAVPEAEAPAFDPAAERKRIKAERRALLLTSPSFVIGCLIVAFWLLCALVPGLLTMYGPTEFNTAAGPRQGPSSDAWFGTNDISNDVFARTIHGARPVLIVAPVAAVLAVIAGTMLGLIMGYFRGIVDEVLSRIIEALLSIPVILLGIMVLATLGNSRAIIIVTIAILFTPVVTRTVRSAVMAEAQLDYITSAKLRGENSMFIMTRELLPNITGVIVVELTVRIGYAVFTVATLAFLGLTAEDSTSADWGVDVAKQRQGIPQGDWWGSVFPALAIASLVIAVNLIADSLDRVNKA